MEINFRFSVIFLFIMGISFFSYAQKGTIRGNVFEDATGESLIGVTVQIKDTSIGSITDFDGKFSISVAPGTYTIQISYVSYQTIIINDIIVEEGGVTLLENIRLKEDVQTLEAVVVTAEVLRNSESALLTVKRKSANLMDGISAAKFEQTGDSDASEAIKRVTGVSVEGGKYVFVRGLGDRYTKTTLNSVDIPGLDPDRNSIQIDIFPTNLIDNMIVLKSSVAEMPADFTGGVVNIETKDFPDQRIFSVSASIGYNPSMHFNKNFLTHNGGSTDWLGFDDGSRARPAQATNLPYPAPGNPLVSPGEVNSYLKEFNKTMGANRQTSFMDYSLGLSLGDQKNFENGNSLGYIFSTTYKNSTVFYDNVNFGEYQRPTFPDEYELVYATVQNGQVGERNVLLGALGGLAFKTQKSKYKLAVMHLQNGISKSGQFNIDDNGSAVGKSGFIGYSDNLEYGQSGVTNFLLNGEHFNEDHTFNVDWRISPTLSKIQEPDIRKTAFTITSSDTVFSSGAAGNPSRIWRELDEVNLVAKVDFTKEHKLFRRAAVLKFGASSTLKERDYEILQYNMQFFGSQPDFKGNPGQVMNDEFLYPNGTVYFASGNPDPNSNKYNSTISNLAAYVSTQFQIVDNLKAIIGLRGEKYLQRHTGRDQEYAGSRGASGNNLDNAVVADEFNLFPSANFILSATENQNIRFSYSKTIARPSFKELSYAQILDPVSNRTFNGAFFKYPSWDGNLEATLIDNIDLRWEMFMKKNEIVSVSGFYKMFKDPIELVRIPEAQTTNEFQPRNVGDGSVLGAEFEFKKSLGFTSAKLNDFYFSGNITVVKSSIEMTEIEFNARKNFEKNGETTENVRPMAGQAPYMINLGLSYENSVLGFDGGLFYNVNGSTLTVVGGGLFPDVFSEPFHSLNFNINKGIGVKKKSVLSFSVSNILGDVKEEFFEGFNATNQYYTSFNPGTSFSFGFKYGL